MLEQELVQLVKKVQDVKAEDSHLEVKEAHTGCPAKLYDTISAFSNQAGGGVILFGLSEKEGFKIVGVYDAADLEKKVTEQCKQMEPKVRGLFTVVSVEGKVVVSVEIPEIDAADKPCFYTGRGRLNGSYIRVGDSDERMTEYEIYSYDAFRRKYQDDIRQVDTSLDMLDQDKIDSYIQRLKQTKKRIGHLPKKDVCELMQIVKNGKPTLAGLLLFGKYPQGLFPQLCMTAIHVPGTEVGETGVHGERFIDNRRIDGTIPEMVEEAVHFVQNNMKTGTVIDPQTAQRRDVTEYPLTAVREIILNAFIHRDYSIHTEGMPAQLILFDDRLEVKNPGGLYGRLTLDDLGKTQPDTRNPAIAVIMEDLGLTENRYSGIPTVYREMKKARLRPPVFAVNRGVFEVTLYNDQSADVSEVREGENLKAADLSGRILAYCRVPRTRQEIRDFTGIKTQFTLLNRYIRPLIQSGQLAMTIPGKPKSKFQKYVAVRS